MKTTTNFTPALQQASGSFPYDLTNDYLFRILFQKNQEALKGLLISLLHLNPDDISSAIITNPIEIGDDIMAKEFILDINVILNGYRQVDLEMQVVNYHDWPERSLNYLCRLFNSLNKGDDYSATLPAIQIGILDFTPFPENPSFYSKNLMMDTENHHVYSSKFAIHVLDLKQVNNASSEDKHWGLDNWAKLFKAATWEDVKMIAANNKYLTEAANTMHELYSDREMRRQMENREDFIRRQKRDQRMLKEQADIIAEKDSALAEKDSALARQADEIALKDSALAEQADEIALKDSALAEQADEIAKLRAQIAALTK